MLLWLAGLALYTTLLVPVGTVLLAFLLAPPWSEEGTLGWLETSFELLTDDEWWVGALAGCAVISLTQCLFLLPVIRLRPPQGTRPRSLTASLVLGALVAALISTALAAGFVLLLFGGTIVELLVVLPIDAMVRRRTDCYCGTGTFFSMCFSAVGLLWLTGPWIVIALTRRRRWTARQSHCGRCGPGEGTVAGAGVPGMLIRVGRLRNR